MKIARDRKGDVRNSRRREERDNCVRERERERERERGDEKFISG
jgi:hypothetical protein